MVKMELVVLMVASMATLPHCLNCGELAHGPYIVNGHEELPEKPTIPFPLRVHAEVTETRLMIDGSVIPYGTNKPVGVKFIVDSSKIQVMLGELNVNK